MIFVCKCFLGGLAASHELFSMQSVISDVLSRWWLLTFAAESDEQPLIKEIIGKH